MYQRSGRRNWILYNISAGAPPQFAGIPYSAHHRGAGFAQDALQSFRLVWLLRPPRPRFLNLVRAVSGVDRELMLIQIACLPNTAFRSFPSGASQPQLSQPFGSPPEKDRFLLPRAQVQTLQFLMQARSAKVHVVATIRQTEGPLSAVRRQSDPFLCLRHSGSSRSRLGV
jgi:hypothetical protein